MPANILVLCSLFLLQCTLGQCAESRLDGLASFPSIPAEFLALKNYGAMDFLSSSLVESIKPDIIPTFSTVLAPEKACENIFLNSNPYVNEITNFEVPGIRISSPVSLEVPYFIDQVLPQSPPILQTPILSALNTPLEPLNINCQTETALELSPYTLSIQSSPYPLVPNLYMEEIPIIKSLPSVDVPIFSNYGELNSIVSPVPSTVSVVPTVFNPVEELNSFISPVPSSISIVPTVSNSIFEVPSRKFYAPAIALPSTPQVMPCVSPSLGTIVDVFSPILSEVPVAVESPVCLNSYATPTLLAVKENIPTYAKPRVSIPTLSSENIASSIANIRSIFPSLPTIPSSSRVRCLSGITSSELSASRGNGLLVTSSSPKRPNGVSIQSENTYQGPVSVSGILPFLGTVGFSGSLPSSGYGAVSYRCGSGNVGMLSEVPNILNSFYSR